MRLELWYGLSRFFLEGHRQLETAGGIARRLRLHLRGPRGAYTCKIWVERPDGYRRALQGQVEFDEEGIALHEVAIGDAAEPGNYTVHVWIDGDNVVTLRVAIA